MIICKNAKNNCENAKRGVCFNRKMQQEIYYGFREKIESKRKEKNISAEYLAKELGISVSTVYRYEVQAY